VAETSQCRRRNRRHRPAALAARCRRLLAARRSA
jgi:hypothetical protein